jgi:hypothetical protein
LWQWRFLSRLVAALPLHGSPNSPDGADKSATGLQTQGAYTALGWDFAILWKMGAGSYHWPVFR